MGVQHRKVKIVAVFLCNGVQYIARKLIGRVAHGNCGMFLSAVVCPAGLVVVGWCKA